MARIKTRRVGDKVYYGVDGIYQCTVKPDPPSEQFGGWVVETPTPKHRPGVPRGPKKHPIFYGTERECHTEAREYCSIKVRKIDKERYERELAELEGEE